MRGFIRDLPGTTMVVNTHIVPQTAVNLTNFFDRDGSISYFTSRIVKNSKHACATSLCISLEIARSAVTV